MPRRLTPLAALVLVACTADLLTEPERYAGPALTAALPPPPAPPQPLETTIQGAGPNVLQVLGFYESPTLARVVVSGVLTYSGLNAGYYPGETGTIDYQGRQIPGQCANNVVVYIQGGGLIGGTYSCPTFWQSIGSQSTLSVVSGQVMLGRNAAAPGACFYGGSPCATISGEQTVTVTPIDGDVKITVDRSGTYPSGLIVAKFTADPEWFENKQMPFTLRQVTFEGSGPVVGGGTTTGCTTWHKANECSFRLYQSGYLVAEAIVSGKLRTTRQWLTVAGGDSMPPPPDTMPTDTIPTDTIPTDTLPTDSLPGDGGDCSASPVAGLYLAECDTASTPAIPLMACSPGTVTRGANVSCDLWVPAGVEFTVDSVVVQAGPHTLRRVLLQHVSAQDSFRLTGPGLLPSSIVAWVTVDSGGQGVTRAASSGFAVAPRPWSELNALWSAPTLHRYTVNTGVVQVSRAPVKLASGGYWIRPAVHIAPQPDWGAVGMGASRASTGPNAGLQYLGAPVSFAGAPTIYTTPYFADTLFLADQNGGLGAIRSRCTLGQFRNSYEPVVEAHEGATQIANSHWGLHARELGRLGLNQRAEALVMTDAVTNDPVDSLAVWYEAWKKNVMAPVNAQFDAAEYPQIDGRAGCELDLDLGDK